MRNESVVTQRSASEITVDPQWLQAFEHQLVPARLAKSALPVNVLGAGKLLAALGVDERPGLVLKRLPPFPSPEALAHYRRAVDAYYVVLRNQMNLWVAEQCCVPVTSLTGAPILYIVQVRLPAESLGPRVLARATDEEAAALFEAILTCVARVWNRNEIDGPDSLTGLDARLSNWSLTLEDGHVGALRYLDTSTPFIRRIGRELLDPELFLHYVPAPFARLLRSPFQRTLARYYDLRLVLIDFVADLYREHQAARVPLALGVVNAFLHSDEAADFCLEPITQAEVGRHYGKDARFWTLFRTVARMNRFVTAYIARQNYPFVLPR